MIGIDTNALLRWLVGDDPDQSALAQARVGRGDDIYLNPVVLAELAWVAGRRIGLDRSGTAGLLRRLLGHPGIVIGSRKEVAEATEAFASGGAGFADHLIGALNAGAGCSTTLTFDKRAAKGPHFTALA